MEQIIQSYNMIFWNFVKNYDLNNPNLMRKVIHSFTVAESCFSIASHLKFDKKTREFLYLIGLLHDLGRFEQWRLFQTYNDQLSVDHASLSSDLIDKMNNKDLFITRAQKKFLREVIYYHNKPITLKNKEQNKYIEIIKNADSFCNIVTIANGAQQMTVNENGVTDEIYNNFVKGKSLYGLMPKTKLDRCLLLCNACNCLTFKFLIKEVVERNYIDCMYEVFSSYLNKEDVKLFQNAMNILRKKFIIQ